MKLSNIWPTYSEPVKPRVADRIKSGADIAAGVSGRMKITNTDFNNGDRSELVSESYPKQGKPKFDDEDCC